MHAPSFSTLSDTRLPVTERFSPPRRCFRPRLPIADAPLPGENLLSITTLYERLALLAKLELPCTILIVNPPLHLRDAQIRSVDWADGNLNIVGDGFSLHLRGDGIQSVHLADIQDGGDGSLDIYHSHGTLYASIRPVPGGIGGAVWRDVMDNPSLLLF